MVYLSLLGQFRFVWDYFVFAVGCGCIFVLRIVLPCVFGLVSVSAPCVWRDRFCAGEINNLLLNSLLSAPDSYLPLLVTRDIICLHYYIINLQQFLLPCMDVTELAF